MEKKKKKKSLAVMDYNIFAKLRRFFINIFNKKQNYYEEEFIEQEEKVEEETTKKTRKLFNYDAEVDDIMPENIPEKDIINEDVEYVDNIADNSEKEVKSKVSEEKEELERKLMNYYASIKNSI